ncbi:MAG: hypothetical protein HY900_29435, partial [Deltaproteobacteria bacterium]|nr:hypothetical protein [Deltaproteobacteria bacterium]
MPVLPLPEDLRQAVGGERALPACSNFGLGFQIYVHHARDEWGYSGDEKSAVWKDVVALSERLHEGGYDGVQERLTQRHESLVRDLRSHYGNDDCVAVFEGRVAWRLTVGLGNEHPLENGVTLHRLYGVPFLPGSAIKGVTRARVLEEEADRLGLSW